MTYLLPALICKHCAVGNDPISLNWSINAFSSLLVRVFFELNSPLPVVWADFSKATNDCLLWIGSPNLPKGKKRLSSVTRQKKQQHSSISFVIWSRTCRLGSPKQWFLNKKWRKHAFCKKKQTKQNSDIDTYFSVFMTTTTKKKKTEKGLFRAK